MKQARVQADCLL